MHDASGFRAPLVERGPACAGATDIGRVRARNEDAYWISDDGSVLAVADGLGGLPAGDVASALAVAAIAEWFEQRRSSERAPRRGDAGAHRVVAGAQSGSAADAQSGSADQLEQQARDAAAHAQEIIMAASHGTPSLHGMATTLVLVVLCDSHASVLHIGDSRAALWRDGAFVTMTIDQNRAGDLLREGVITREQARVHPSRNLVREVVGRPDGYEAECQTWEIRRGDILVALTDGVSEALSEHRLARILETAPDAAAAASSIVELAAIEGGHDNATAVVRYVT